MIYHDILSKVSIYEKRIIPISFPFFLTKKKKKFHFLYFSYQTGNKKRKTNNDRGTKIGEKKREKETYSE